MDGSELISENHINNHPCYLVELGGLSRLYPNSVEFVIGRGKCSGLRISSYSVSRKHCEIRRTDHGWNITNKSTYGISLNGKILTNSDPVNLSNSDLLILGDVYLQCFLDVDSERFRRPVNVLKISVLVGSDECSLNLEIQDESHSGKFEETPGMLEMDGNAKMENIMNVAETNSQERFKQLVLESPKETELIQQLQQLRENNLMLTKELEESNKAYTQVVSEKEEASLKLSQIEQNMSHSVEDLVETELLCSICHEIVINATTSNCSHTFCEYCFLKWTKKNNICPVCRTNISSHIRTKMIDSFIEKLILNLPEEIQEKRKEMVESRKELTNALTENHRPRKRRRTMTAASRNGRQAITITLQNLASLMDTTIDISSDDESPVFLFQQRLQP